MGDPQVSQSYPVHNDIQYLDTYRLLEVLTELNFLVGASCLNFVTWVT